MSNLHFDLDEIQKFERMAHEWWDEQGKFKPLHQMNPLRLQYIVKRAELSNAHVLDVGCGGGLLAENMAKHAASVTGLDRSQTSLGVAMAHAEASGVDVHYQCSDAETWALEHAQNYDVVTCLEVLEHVPDVVRTVQACAAMLKPDGLFFFATLNRSVKSYMQAILGAEYVMGWLPKGTHDHASFIRPSEMVFALRAAGLQVQDLCGMSYDFSQQAFHVSDDLSVNYIGVAQKVSSHT